MPKVTTIPATKDKFTAVPFAAIRKRRTAGYARVSTDSEEQATSYEAQVDYYTNYIKANPEWEFVGVYTDDGISATNTKRRDGFNQMVQDALDGKIDLIITKSVSRFARNTVDSLTTIRELKAHGTECYFEKEGIWTFDSKGELLITIMSSLAQEESRSISENVTWGKRKQFQDGKVSMAYKHFLGYRKGADGLPEIVPEEAEIVRRIYRMFIEGKTVSAIAKALTAGGIPTPAGKEVWQMAVVESILTNEKYKGDARLQKSFTVDFLTKKMKVNEGEVPQYYVEGSHPGIIAPEEWNKVQLEMSRRKSGKRRTLCNSPFAGMLVCGDCGEYFGSKVWHSNDPYRKVIWQCNDKFKGEKKCGTPHLTDEQIKNAYHTALSELLADREAFFDDVHLLMDKLADDRAIEDKIQAVMDEMSTVSALIRQCIEDNAARAQDQGEYQKRYDALVERYKALMEKGQELVSEKDARQLKKIMLGVFLHDLENIHELEPAFSEQRWRATVEQVTVHHDGRLVFRFKNGAEITTGL